MTVRVTARAAARRPGSGRPPGAVGVAGAPALEHVAVWRDGPVGWLVLDRPAVGNALDATMMRELPEAWAALDGDPGVVVIACAGRGDAFCTGLDVAQLAADRAALADQSRRTRDADLRLTAWHCGVWKPVIAAVGGTCAGGGLHFVVDADVVVCAADATFVDPHVSVGQAVAFEAITLARKSPMEPVTRLALGGRRERLDAGRAHQLGICSQIVDPPAALWDEVQTLGEVIARHPLEQLRATKQALWHALETAFGSQNGAGAP